MDLAQGSSFGDYRVERLIARGGMGAVYLASENQTARVIALKLVRADLARDPEFRARFARESRLTAELDHPHIVPLYAAGEVEGVLFLASRFIGGLDLEALLADRRKLHPRWASLLTAQVGSALDAAHRRGLVHRDVKPGNILIEPEGGTAHAYLADFGLSKHVRSRSGLTRPGMWVGTIDYAAPEQLQAQAVGPPTDIYALGCVLYQMLAGEVPFPRSRDVEKLAAHAAEAPPTLSGLPDAFNGVVARALAKRPAERYRSAGELASAAATAAEQAGSLPQRPLIGDVGRGKRATSPIDRGAPAGG